MLRAELSLPRELRPRESELTGAMHEVVAMSAENVDVVRRIHAADARGDYELALSFFSPSVELDATHMPDGRVFRGLDEVTGHIADWRSGWRDFREEVEEGLDAG